MKNSVKAVFFKTTTHNLSGSWQKRMAYWREYSTSTVSEDIVQYNKSVRITFEKTLGKYQFDISSVCCLM